MLNKTYALLAATVVTAAAGLFVAPLGAADDKVVAPAYPSALVINDKTNLLLPDGITGKQLNDDKSIEKSFKSVTESALSTTGLDNVVGMLVDQDRVRVKKSLDRASYSNVDGKNNKKLIDLVNSLNETWKSKYSQKVGIDASKTFTDSLVIMTGEVSDPDKLVGNWPIAPTFDVSGSGKMSPADAKAAREKLYGGDVNLEKGRKVAIVHFRSNNGMPALGLSMIHETMGGWKFDAPNTLTVQKLYDNLVANLSYIDARRDTLPLDINEANRALAHAVVAAISDIDLSLNANNPNGKFNTGALAPASDITVGKN